ncbi:hypothetical protein PHK61_30500 [Actinomycetospora lutea]|uniref:hypothetical protein n=1 Tax=Actinomycetospora lutea TaxID=663604 RepID=UPI0023661FFF|nr:hypothetical protein [Actinomycetospora lutea]MDD7942753.1 hypothetical protein [Actinomycetospora lutea]
MGRHSRSDPTAAASEPVRPRRIALAVRHTIPAPAVSPGADITTLTIRPLGPAAALRADTAVPPAGPPARLSRRDRRAARHEEAERAALAARIGRAQRRNRQVAASGVPAPRSADPSSISGPLSIDAVAAARPPWSAGS